MPPQPTIVNSDPAFMSNIPEGIPPEKSNKKKIIIIVVIALVLLCCCAVIIGGIAIALTQGGGDFNWEFDTGSLLLNHFI